MSTRAITTGVVIVMALLTGCDAGSSAPRAAEESSPPPAPSPSVAAGPEVIQVAGLPTGAPPRVAYLAGGSLHWHGRTVRTDLPAAALSPMILGAVDGRPVVFAYVVDPPDSGDRFWTIDVSGRAQRLGRTYQYYDYEPRLVEETGHIWVQYGNRTTRRTIWEIDGRTGQELAAYPHNQVPHGLAPADQALVDAWVERREALGVFDATSRDGSLTATVRSVDLGAGWGETIVVRQTSDRTPVASFTFPDHGDGGVDQVVFEDGAHVLVLVTDSNTRRHGPQQAVVRCSVVDGSCELATGIGGNVAVGVVRPLFAPKGTRP
jgi:hypothetical protein